MGEASLFEELRCGLFFGTVSFADKIKSRYLREVAPHPEVPQQTMPVMDHGPEKLVNELSVVLGCNPGVFRESSRISEADKRHRDLMYKSFNFKRKMASSSKAIEKVNVTGIEKSDYKICT